MRAVLPLLVDVVVVVVIVVAHALMHASMPAALESQFAKTPRQSTTARRFFRCRIISVGPVIIWKHLLRLVQKTLSVPVRPLGVAGRFGSDQEELCGVGINN
ncbi:hypothetical protein IWX47DRAFT_242344 [Phyllosticta citricarpa]|uniref:Secreted protein n=1 Tax=Phyllosticta citricarpa TaxID=55181 RepID=A0ABR1MJY0_9PEZI